jgi:hypothetical protein
MFRFQKSNDGSLIIRSIDIIRPAEKVKRWLAAFFLHFVCLFGNISYLCKTITVIIIMTIIICGYEVL